MVALSLCVLARALAPAASEAQHHHPPASAARAYGSCGWGKGLSTQLAAPGGSGRDSPQSVLVLWLG